MKYSKKFKDLADARAQGANGLLAPHVDTIKGFNIVNYYEGTLNTTFTCNFDNKGHIIIPPESICFSAASGQTVSLSAATSPNLKYSYDGFNWVTWDYSPLIFGTTEHPRVYINGENETFNTTDNANVFVFGNTLSMVDVSGNVMALLDGENPSKEVYGDSCFSYLFSSADALKSVSKGFLPATALTPLCYACMFSGCTSLVSVPELPATTLEYGCYAYMFQDCTSLASMPELPATVLGAGCYGAMFAGCINITSAPALPATTLKSGCYSGMFEGCTSLATTPALPATTLSDECYYSMFNGCTSLTGTSILPATTLASSCYNSMFGGCTALTTAPTICATTLANYCCQFMFQGCTSLTSAPALPATTLAGGCYYSMFNSCESLTTAPELPATTLADACYEEMFANCISLTTAPELPATTLAQSCYYKMFNSCSNLNEIHCAATDITASYCTSNWVVGVAETGNFYGKTDAGWTTGGNGIPTGWNFIDMDIVYFNITSGEVTLPSAGTFDFSYNGEIWAEASASQKFSKSFYLAGKNSTVGQFGITGEVGIEGNAMYLIDYSTIPTTVPAGAFYGTFSGCTGLTGVSSDFLPTETGLDNSCYFAMFAGCTSLTTAPKLPATTLANSCYHSMFLGCTSLTTAPALPADTIGEYCYSSMFNGCTSLTAAPELPATTIGDTCYKNMFTNCTSLTTVPKISVSAFTEDCCYAMFSGCSSLNEIHCDATDISGFLCVTNWVSGVASSGDFYGKTAANWPDGESGIPTGWEKHMS